MEVITIDSRAFKALEAKINSIAEYVTNNQNGNKEIKEDDIWVESYEICAYLQISPKTLQRLRKGGQLHFSMMRGRCFYKISEIKKALNQRQINTTQENLTSLISNHRLNVFRHYISGDWRLGRNFLNPLYPDKNASCNVFYDRHNGIYKIKDFGNDGYCGDCFSFVGQLMGLNCASTNDFVQIMRIINNDLSLGISESPDTTRRSTDINYIKPAPIKSAPTKPEIVKHYTFQEQPFSKSEINFWNSYGINKDILLMYNICSIKVYESTRADAKPFALTS